MEGFTRASSSTSAITWTGFSTRAESAIFRSFGFTEELFPTQLSTGDATSMLTLQAVDQLGFQP